MKSKTLSRVRELAKPHKKTIMTTSILSLIIGAGEIIKPYLLEIAIDDYIAQGIFQKGSITVGMIGAFYIAIVLLGNFIDFITTTTVNMLGEEVIYTLRNKLFKFTQNTSISFHDKTSAGKLFVRITNDVEDISTLFKDVVATIVKDIILILAIAVIMLYFNSKLGVLSFIVVPFIILFSMTLTAILHKQYDVSKVIRTNLNTFLAESIYGAKIIKVFNIQREKQKQCETFTRDFCKARVKTGFIEGLLPALMTVLENVGIAIIVVACTNHIWGIALEVGFIYAFISYIKQIFEPINRIIENIETVQEAFVSIDKIYDILDQKEYLEDFESGVELKEVKGKIEFKHVWFSYDNGENWILKDVSFTINPGESIALVGKTGSGKTTITNLINRFYDIQKGEILLDGVNIKDINLRSLRSNIGIILQDPFIFAKSIKENIKLYKNLSDEDIGEAIELASADEFINSLPEGMEAIANERGNSYSEGQKQLIAFARVFANNPNIFVLDEATANIDTYTESLIQKSIDRLSANKTSIFIAHRLSTIVNVDKIIVLSDGEIVEEGNHEKLLQTGGYYSKLYNAYYESLG